jgi:hypothetical protein
MSDKEILAAVQGLTPDDLQQPGNMPLKLTAPSSKTKKAKRVSWSNDGCSFTLMRIFPFQSWRR